MRKMDAVFTLEWAPQPGSASIVATVPLSNRNFAAVASRIWTERVSEPETVLSAASDIDLVVGFISIVDQEARSRALSASDAADDPIFALLHQLVAHVLRAANGSSLGALLRVHNREGCARMAVLARARELAGSMTRSVPFAESKAKIAFLEAAGSGNAAGFLQFGGQGYPSLPELSTLVSLYPSTLRPLVQAVSACLKEQVVAASCSTDAGTGLGRYHAHGFDVAAWVGASSTTSAALPPPDSYLYSAPISFALIGLTQCAAYAALVASLGLAESDNTHAYGGWERAKAAWTGATGHSQGVVTAAVVSASHDMASFTATAAAACTLLFWQGARMQEAYDALPAPAKLPPPKAVPGAAPADSPTPMLSVTGLTPAQLQKHVDGVCTLIDRVEAAAGAAEGGGATPSPGRILPLVISLVNGYTSCIVSGRSAHTAALYAVLDGVRAAPGAEQARVPHSSRKPVLRMAFLRVSAPFHSPLLASAVPLATADCARAGVQSSLPRSALTMPVFSSEDARDLRSWDEEARGGRCSLAEELIRLQCVLPVDWPASVRVMHRQGAGAGWASTTHVLDLGPGGAGGTARMTARLLAGTGVSVLMASLAAVTVSQDSEGSSSEAASVAAAAASACGSEGLPLYDVRALLSPRHDVLGAVASASPDWAALHGPRLVKRVCDGALLLDTAYSRLLGRPPIMVAGMTPCTSYYGIPLVAGCLNAGYHAELACGGLPRPSIFRERIAKLQAALHPGQGIGLNMLFLNARQWAFQYPMVATLIAEGVPIETVCIAAGVPSYDNGVEVVRTLARGGVKYVSFKPGSVDAIKRTLEIAAAVAPFPVVLQWTGGRAGGHHSFEDVHAPMLATYASIRRARNVVLLAGSGMGSAACAAPWIDGTWAVAGGWSSVPMPFDGVLLASRVMVSREATTSYEVKRLLVDTPGIANEGEWEGTYDGVAGGILTVKSELGEPIHKVANRGMTLWRDMDRKYFALSKEARGAAIAGARDAIIARLNADYQKQYFGLTRPDGSIIHPPHMTYAEVATRMVETMYVSPEKERLDVEPPHENYTPFGRWVDPSFRDRLFLFLQRAESALRPLTPGADTRPVLLTAAAQLNPGAAASATSGKASPVSKASLGLAATSPTFAFDHPAALVKAFFSEAVGYPAGATCVLTARDYDAWLEDCRSRGKPVPFVPVVDGDLENWFKKDSLWYSEDLAAVPDRDAGRVAILQGPVAVRHSTVVNEPVGEILGGVEAGLVAHILRVGYGGVQAQVPHVEAAGGAFATVRAGGLAGVKASVQNQDGATVHTFTALPAAEPVPVPTSTGDDDESAPVASDIATESTSLLSSICAHLSAGASAPPQGVAWVIAVLGSPRIVHDTSEGGPGSATSVGGWKWAANSLQRVFAPRPGSDRTLSICVPAGADEGTVVTMSEHGCVVASARLSASSSTVEVQLCDSRPATADEPEEACRLSMRLAYSPARPFAPLSLHAASWALEVKRYYASLWFSDRGAAEVQGQDVRAPLLARYTVTAADIEAFCASTGTPVRSGSGADGSPIPSAPLSFAIVAGWRALIACLFPRTITGDILSLVHLSNSFEAVEATPGSPPHAHAPLTAGEEVTSRLFVTEVTNGPSGKTVTVEGLLLRGGGRWGAVTIPWARIRSQFLFRGSFTDHSCSFRRTHPDTGSAYEVALASPATLAVLASKPWFKARQGALPGAGASDGTAASSTASTGDPTSPTTLAGSPAASVGVGVFPPLSPGDVLRFTVHVSEEFADASTLSAVRVRGTVERTSCSSATSAKACIVGDIDYTYASPSPRAGLKANTVQAYLLRASAPAAPAGPDGMVPLESGGYTLLATPDVVDAPTSNVPYAVSSRDLNPIHRHKGLADLAGLPAPIVHGMWTSANGQRVLHAALDLELSNTDPSGRPAYSHEAARMVRSYSATFTGMVLPGDKLVTQVTHVGMMKSTGARVMRVCTTAVRASGLCEAVLHATARVDPASTAYVFTGQGSASPGMGMELYESSSVARGVWDTADAHLRAVYGFSILSIVRTNPKTLTVHFGGRKGATVRANYMALETEAGDGSGRRVPLLPDITELSDSFTFVHPEGLLFATQFTQPALVLVEKAAFDDMVSVGLVPGSALFAGHSLGEYAALSAAVPLLPASALVSLVFLRGMVMQNAVPRDESGRSDFGMVACNPQRVGPMLTESALHALVEGISKGSKCLLEVVNYNVMDRQYVVAGHLRALDILSNALSIARKEPAAAGDPMALVKRSFAITDKRMAEADAAGRKLTLDRGEATIPLGGVDVPFHSRFLRGGVPSFRSVLRSQLTLPAFSQPGVIPRMLGCYLPNLTALPFSTDRYFVAEALRRTDSPVLASMLASEAAWKEAQGDPLRLAHALVVELLAYQFASPVQWVATQHFMMSGEVAAPSDAPEQLATWPACSSSSPALPTSVLAGLGFKDDPKCGSVAGVRRVVEVGPAMTLVGMAARTLESRAYGGRDGKRTGRSLLWYGKDADVMYYKGEGAGESDSEYASGTVAPARLELNKRAQATLAAPAPAPVVAAKQKAAAVVPKPVSAAPPAPAPAPVPSAAAAGPVSGDEPPTALEAIQVMLAVKLAQPLAAVKPDATIKALVGGKSAVQNEILGELEKEFGSGPDGGAEMPLSDLAKAVSKGYKGVGKVTSALIAKVLSGKMPGGFGPSAVKEYLATAKGLGPGRLDGVLMHSVTCAPEARFGGEGDAKAWLDKAADSYAAFKGISLSRPAGGVAVGVAGGPALSPELLAMLLGGGGGGGGVGDSASGGASGPIEDATPSPIEFVRTLLTVKLNLSLAAVKPDATIKALVGGKSAVQNEILGELEKEFGSGPDGGAEMPLSDLAKAAGGKYKGLGKVGSALVAKLVSSKMPGGLGMAGIREHLASSRGCGPGRTDSVLLYGLTCAPEARLGGEGDAKAWLDSAADAYAREYSLTLRSGGGGGSGRAGGGGAGAAAALAAMLGGGVSGGVDKPGAALIAYQKRMSTLIADQVSAYDAFTGTDSMAWHKRAASEAAGRAEAEAALAVWRGEHASSGGGDAYEVGIRSTFDPRKVRDYGSSWAWGAQEVHALLHAHLLPALFKGGSTAAPSSCVLPTDRLQRLLNRTCQEVLSLVRAADSTLARAQSVHATAPWAIPAARSPLAVPRGVSPLGLTPLFAVYSQAGAVGEAIRPTYAASFAPTAPRVTMSSAGKLAYADVPRAGVPTSRAYVVEMARAAAAPQGFLSHLLAQSSSLYPGALRAGCTLPQGCDAASALMPHVHLRCTDAADSGARVLDEPGTLELYRCLIDLTTDLPDVMDLLQASAALGTGGPSPGVSFAGRTALITGCGPGSIGLELVRGLLAGGATVIATTSRFTMASTTALKRVYQECGARGSRLIVLPCNQGSAADCSAVIAHVCSPATSGGLGLELDFLIPFGAVPEAGVEADSLHGGSELAHRLMMTNVMRMMGAVAASKRGRGVDSRPALTLLPLSPNHGVFGGDGLYAESKMGLESLLHKWRSEDWGDYVTIAGAVIGWTRGTGLMAGNNIVSPRVEGMGCRTFSQTEMALNLLALLHPRMARLASTHPLWADLRGGFHAVPDLKGVTVSIRSALEAEAAVARAVTADGSRDGEGGSGERTHGARTHAPPSAHVRLFEFPPLPSQDRLTALSCGGALTGLVDLDRTVVAVGYGEVGPWGSARTRWDMEKGGEFSLEGSILLAWITGRIKYASGPHPSGEGGATFHGWVDASTGEALVDADIKARYEADMLAHAGIRVIEPALFAGYDPARKLFLHTVALDRDMGWIEVASKGDAEEYVAWMGADKVDVRQDDSEGGAGVWRIRLKKGATLSVPRALRFDRWVAGQLPTGWDASRLGVPADLMARMDPVVLFALVATAEALMAAGVSDAYEFFKYVHVSAVGNSIGGGMGGMASLQKIFRQRFMEGEVQSDILQESFINTTPAWVNMLLLSASGPLKTPVGACATAAQSVDIGVETILSGKASVMICGGYDDFCEEGSYEFAQMGATSNSAEESAMGREPAEMVRPFAPSRGGFMESQGAGVCILTTARLALAMGLPLQGVIALSNTASDKAGRSVPAPGQGVLTSAREAPLGLPLGALPGMLPPAGAEDEAAASAALSVYASASAPLLDVGYRRRRLAAELAGLAAWRVEEEAAATAEAAAHAVEAAAAARASEASQEGAEAAGRGAAARWSGARMVGVHSEWTRLEASARARWCSDYWRSEPRIAPLRGALSVFGLSVDDITVASFHGTGTEANDKNESELVHTQMAHMGRSPGCPLYVVAQKALTGHPKGAAAAWMLNGAFDMLREGVVPGNANGDDIDPAMRAFTHLAYLSRPLALGPGGVRAVLLKSFGFGQAGGEVLVLHPDYLLAACEPRAREAYVAARGERQRRAGRAGQDVLSGRIPLVRVKSSPPYTPSQAHRVYLDPGARACWDEAAGEHRFSEEGLQAGVGLQAGGGASAAAVSSPSAALPELPPVTADARAGALRTAVAAAAAAAVRGGGGAGGGQFLGVDVEPVRTFHGAGDAFLSRNFTPAEVSYARSCPDPPSTLAGRWAGKEAVVKALTAAARGAGAAGEGFTLRGAGAGLADIEIVPTSVPLADRSAGSTTSGAPVVTLHGHAAAAAAAAGLDAARLRITISHSGEYAVAVAAI